MLAFSCNLLWSLGGVIGVFISLDMFLFFFFWEMMLVPVYFLIADRVTAGSDGKSQLCVANKFFILPKLAADYVGGYFGFSVGQLPSNRRIKF